MSFILENRSSDLNLMNQAIQPFLVNKTRVENGFVRPNYDDISDAFQATNFTFGQIALLLIYYDEPMSNRNFTDTAFSTGLFNETNDFINWRLIQSFNLFMGARVNLSYQALGSSKKTFSKFFEANIASEDVLLRLLEMQEPLLVDKVEAEEILHITLEALFYNYNIETAALYTFRFTNSELGGSGFQKELDVLLFMPRVNDFISAYFETQVLVWVIRAFYLLTFIYFVFNFIQDLMLMVSKSTTEIKENLSFWYVIYTVYTVINIKYFVDYLNLLASPILFKGVPLSKTEEFEQWLTMATNQKAIMVLNGVLTIILITRVMEMLRVRFRSVFTLVFYSFTTTGKYMLAYFIVAFPH